MRTNIRIATAIALVAGVALTAAPASARTTAPKGACKLLTVKEVGNILGTPAGAGKAISRKSTGQTNESCEWKAKKKGTGGLGGKALSLEIAVESGGNVADEYQSQKSEDPTTPSSRTSAWTCMFSSASALSPSSCTTTGTRSR